MQNELDEQDAKQMGIMERRIRSIAIQKKISMRVYYCALVSVLCDFALNTGVPKERLLESIENSFDAIQRERTPTKH